MTMTEKVAALRQFVWNGVPIRYEARDVDSFDQKFTTFILCVDYVRENDNFPRYAAVRGGKVVAVELSTAGNFANLVVDPLFKGNLCLLPPYYDRGRGELEYVVPVIEDKEDYSVC